MQLMYVFFVQVKLREKEDSGLLTDDGKTCLTRYLKERKQKEAELKISSGVPTAIPGGEEKGNEQLVRTDSRGQGAFATAHFCRTPPTGRTTA